MNLNQAIENVQKIERDPYSFREGTRNNSLVNWALCQMRILKATSNLDIYNAHDCVDDLQKKFAKYLASDPDKNADMYDWDRDYDGVILDLVERYYDDIEEEIDSLYIH